MKSRVHPKYKTKYRVTNWTEYDQALVQRGNITFWITPDAIKAWTAKPSGSRGAPRKYTDLAIETALTLRLVFRLPLRQAEGFLRSLFDLMGLSLESPDHTTLSRRSTGLNVKLSAMDSKKPTHLIVDSTGLSIVGEGEWAAAKHGGRGKRGWRKLHISVDRAAMIRAQVLTNSSGDDATTGIKNQEDQGQAVQRHGRRGLRHGGHLRRGQIQRSESHRPSNANGIGVYSQTEVRSTGPDDSEGRQSR